MLLQMERQLKKIIQCHNSEVRPAPVREKVMTSELAATLGVSKEIEF